MMGTRPEAAKRFAEYVKLAEGHSEYVYDAFRFIKNQTEEKIQAYIKLRLEYDEICKWEHENGMSHANYTLVRTEIATMEGDRVKAESIQKLFETKLEERIETDRQEELLNIMQEECAEIIQVISKIKRFGRNSFHPDDPTKTSNMVLLAREYGDLLETAKYIDIYGEEIGVGRDRKYKNLKKYKVITE